VKSVITVFMLLILHSPYANDSLDVSPDIEIENGSLMLNKHKISMPSNIDAWVNALGPFSRGGEDPLWGIYMG
jgi:hypothetical protein